MFRTKLSFEKNRVTEKWDSRKQRWNKIKFKNLRKGDLFRLFEPDTLDLVTTREGNTVFWADSDAYLIEGTKSYQVKFESFY